MTAAHGHTYRHLMTFLCLYVFVVRAEACLCLSPPCHNCLFVKILAVADHDVVTSCDTVKPLFHNKVSVDHQVLGEHLDHVRVIQP
ncbi:hypothetical protein BgiBS90_017582 [Biomphalaria glabrata]|nr:hypothetical protein BgiBS90_017582 [Biomphalaria glabrata]